ncbi:MAG: cryptochrome/photolyase family protein [Ectothiorhodospiraceae bacterium]|nr:cryptochrome/photolyase family protein [Ectothiorhodospiraceae bacterium]MCH8503140.1 cryptochrome/photolyase family protein [Ectothiorhodospiraceae bacterium]
MKSVRRLLVCLGDQLDPDSRLFRCGSKTTDQVWMAEVRQESTHVWSHKTRIALFLAAMRHHAVMLDKRGWQVDYQRLGDHEQDSLEGALAKRLRAGSVDEVCMVKPGDHRVEQGVKSACEGQRVPLRVLEDSHFYDTPQGFANWAEGRKQLRLEYYYRELRRRHGVLMQGDGPAGGRWNFDADNRQSFGSAGPQELPAPVRFEPDGITREVLYLVEREFADHPGDLSRFDWPVTPDQAEQALEDFIHHRLANFGPYQDALWTGEPWLYHSRLSAALNLKLLNPRSAVEAAERAWRDGVAPLASVEGFVRQILGWREYVRGLYWREMPDYLAHNALNARRSLPGFYWTGKTEMRCLADALGQTLGMGYAHHIQRLMIIGLYALLYGVEPKQVHEWYLAVYVDAVEWVEAPNTIGMSQFGDGGLMASKPYCASGKYVQRMSNYCGQCRYKPDQRTGSSACPFTTLYWDFLDRNREQLQHVPRMNMQLRNLERLSAEALDAIRQQAEAHRRSVQRN